jgi:hypothetical protein
MKVKRSLDCKPEAREIDPGKIKTRAKISNNKISFLNAIIDVLNDLKDYWPVTDRQIHYRLLNDPPKIRQRDTTGNIQWIYYNNEVDRKTKKCKSYSALTGLLTQARVNGDIPFHVIADKTRPHTPGRGFQNLKEFETIHIERFLQGYSRDLMQSQPAHIEIVGEKNTIQTIVQRAADPFCIPVTMGRGFNSLSPRYELKQRFEKSGKARLIIIVASDLDPEGDAIAQAMIRSMRDDFNLRNVTGIRAALTMDQVKHYKLIPGGKAKTTSKNYKKYINNYNTNDVYELESVEPKILQQIITETIEQVINQDLYLDQLFEESNDTKALEENQTASIEFFKKQFLG